MTDHVEHIMDERYAAIDVLGKGLVIFSAYVPRLIQLLTVLCSRWHITRCSHAGIVNVVKHAVDTFSRPVYMVSVPAKRWWVAP